MLMWFKRLLCNHKWKYKASCCPKEEWFVCRKCGKTKDVGD